MYCQEAPLDVSGTTMSFAESQKESVSCPAGATLFFPTLLSLADPDLAKRALRMRCVYKESFGRVVTDKYPSMNTSFLTPVSQSPIVEMRSDMKSSVDTGYRSNTDSYADRQKQFEGGAQATNGHRSKPYTYIFEGGAQATNEIYKHLLVQKDESGRDFIVVHTVCLDHIEERLESGEWVSLSWSKSQEFIELLLRPLSEPPNLTIIDWRPGDLLIFDNLMLQHSVSPANAYHGLSRRVMTRTAMNCSSTLLQ